MTTTVIRRHSPQKSRRGRLLFLLLMLIPAAAGAQGRGGLDSTYRAPASVRGSGPGGATLRCADGSLAAPGASDAACNAKGGVGVRFPLLRTPPAAAATSASTSSRPALPVAPAASPAPAGAAAPTRERTNAPTSGRLPVDATLICVDGSYVRTDTASARCAAHGGVHVRLPWRPTR